MSSLSMAFGSVVAVAVVQACDLPSSPRSADTAPRPAPAAPQAKTVPLPQPAAFVSAIDNPYFPLAPGTAFHYRSETQDGVETEDVEVTHDTKLITGVSTTVVHDFVRLDGEPLEETFDWYAQDGDGNVWYFGEDSKEFEDGEVVSTEGSWEAGVDGARPGIVMLAHPRPGASYRQELAPDVAEDMARVLGVRSSVTVPYGDFDACVHTLEWSPLELGVREQKFYCPGIGLVLEVHPREGHVTNELQSLSRF
jgi:hypothetical protein